MRGKRGILCLMLAAAVLLGGCSNLMLFEAQMCLGKSMSRLGAIARQIIWSGRAYIM